MEAAGSEHGQLDLSAFVRFLGLQFSTRPDKVAFALITTTWPRIVFVVLAQCPMHRRCAMLAWWLMLARWQEFERVMLTMFEEASKATMHQNPTPFHPTVSLVQQP